MGPRGVFPVKTTLVVLDRFFRPRMIWPDPYGIGARVHFPGRCPLDAIPEYMALGSVLVSPRLEPYVTPLKIYAYMASGRPIVATRLPTHTDVLDDESAILVPPSPEGIAEGIVDALKDPRRADKLALRARQLVCDTYNYDTFKRKLGEVYDFLMAQRGGRR